MSRTAEFSSNTPEARMMLEFSDLVEDITGPAGEDMDHTAKDFLLRSPLIVEDLILNSFSTIISHGEAGNGHAVNLRTGLKGDTAAEETRPDITFYSSPSEPLTFYGPSKDLTGPFEEREPLDQHDTLERYRELCDHLRQEFLAGLTPG